VYKPIKVFNYNGFMAVNGVSLIFILISDN